MMETEEQKYFINLKSNGKTEKLLCQKEMDKILSKKLTNLNIVDLMTIMYSSRIYYPGKIEKDLLLNKSLVDYLTELTTMEEINNLPFKSISNFLESVKMKPQVVSSNGKCEKIETNLNNENGFDRFFTFTEELTKLFLYNDFEIPSEILEYYNLM